MPQDPTDEPADQLLERILAERRAQWEAEAWQKEIKRAQKKAAQAQRKVEGRPYRIRDMEPGEWLSLPEEEYAPYLPKNDKWKRKHDVPQPPDTDDLPALPESWVWTNFLSVTIDGPQNGLYLPQEQYGAGVPILRIDDYQFGWSLTAEEMQKVTASEAWTFDKSIASRGGKICQKGGTAPEVEYGHYSIHYRVGAVPNHIVPEFCESRRHAAGAGGCAVQLPAGRVGGGL